MTHICVTNLTIIGSDNGLSPGRRQAIIWTNAGILLIGPLETKFSEINSYVFMHENAFENVVCEMAAILSRPQCVKIWNPIVEISWSLYCLILIVSLLWLISIFILTWGLDLDSNFSWEPSTQTGVYIDSPPVSYSSLPVPWYIRTLAPGGRYLGHGYIITSHRKLWDVITYPYSKDLPVVPNFPYSSLKWHKQECNYDPVIWCV